MMTPERSKFCVELLKIFSTFIIGTGAGIYGLVTLEKPTSATDALLVFSIILCSLSIICFFLLVMYLEFKTK